MCGTQISHLDQVHIHAQNGSTPVNCFCKVAVSVQLPCAIVVLNLFLPLAPFFSCQRFIVVSLFE